MPETPIFSSAAVAAPHSLAAQAGRAVLAEGGNAIEAMVAMAATIAVVYPHMNAHRRRRVLARPRARRARARASRPAARPGASRRIERYREKGYDAIPARGPDAALTVAGAVGGWAGGARLAQALGGRLPLDVLLGRRDRLCPRGLPGLAPRRRADVPKELDDAARRARTSPRPS